MDLSDLIVLTPPGLPDPSLAVAAARAGARGTLDLEFVPDAGRTGQAVDRLAQFAGGRFGVKLGANAGRLVSALLRSRAGRPAWVILAGGDVSEHADTLRRFREAGAEVLIEAIGLSEAVWACDMQADGV